MKNLVKTSFILLALVSMLFTSCRKEYEIPPIHSVPFGDTLTIGDILAMPAKTTFDTASVCGIISADEQSGNLYKTVFIQDRATGKAIELRLSSSSAARIGDSVRVCLDPSLMYNPYHNLPQITDKNGNGFNPDGHLLIYPYNKPIEPKAVTIAEIKSGAYIGALVKLDSVEFVEKNVPFCEVGETTNRHLIDATSPTSDDNFVVRTSNYANFAYDYMPISKGSLVGIASIYNSTYQILLRSKNEMIFSEWGTPATPAGGVQPMPYIQSFESAFGTYTTYNVEGTQTWVIEYSSAKITGHEGGSGGTDYANEDWLISSPVAITDVNHAKAVINYAAKYTAPIDGDVTLQVSSNYEFGNDPTTATWVELQERLENNSPGSSWDFSDKEANLDQFIGQTVTFAVKFISTTSGSRTIEIKNITIMEGEAGSTPTPPTPGTGEGSGTQEDPYNVAAGIANQDWNSTSSSSANAPIAWVQGYIVGAVKNGVTSVSSNDQINWSGSFDSSTNVVIADDASCQEISQCIIVNLPAGKPLRTQVNLVDNPGNLGKLLAVTGKLYPYFSKAGLRESGGTEADFILEGGTPTPPPTPVGIFSESFANGQGDFNIVDVNLSGLTYVWTYMNNYHCMKANGYYQGAHDAESWLVSPQIDMTSVTTATLSFEHALAFADGQGVCSVQVSTNYNGDVSTATWTELPIQTWPEQSSSFPFVSTTASMDQFAGQTVTIAFKYNCTTSQCPAWEVKNVVVE